MENNALTVFAFAILCFVIVFLIFGIPGYFQPNPVIAAKVAIGLPIGLAIVIFRYLKMKNSNQK